MTSQATAGYQGVFKVSTVALIQVNSIELTSAGETYDVTTMNGMTTPQWKIFLSGLRSWTLKVSGFWDQVNDALQATLWTDYNNGTQVPISFSPNASTNTFTGNALFTQIPMKFPVGGVETVEWDFQGTGPLSFV